MRANAAGREARRVLLTVAAAGTTLVAGCSGYYRVTDPASGKQFYTHSVDRSDRQGYIEFTDVVTGAEVTLQSSEVKKIDSATFEAAVKSPK